MPERILNEVCGTYVAGIMENGNITWKLCAPLTQDGQDNG